MGKRKTRLEIYVDGSFKDGKGGIGFFIKRNGKFDRQMRFKLSNCTDAYEVEFLAVTKGIEYSKGKASPHYTIVYTDCLNVVKHLNGKLNEIEVRWIPRELNEAHDMAIRGRLTKKETKRYYRKNKAIAERAKITKE